MQYPEKEEKQNEMELENPRCEWNQRKSLFIFPFSSFLQSNLQDPTLPKMVADQTYKAEDLSTANANKNCPETR